MTITTRSGFFTQKVQRLVLEGTVEELLKEVGADSIKTLELGGRSLLHFAALFGNEMLARSLIAMGLQINLRDNSGRTALYAAVIGKHTNLVKLLLSSGAEVEGFEDPENNEFIYSMECMGPEGVSMMKILLEGVLKGCKSDNEKWTKLQTLECSAIIIPYLNDAQLTEYVIDRGCPVDSKLQNSGKTALHISVHLLYDSQVHILLKKGANVNIKDNQNRTPLHYLSSLEPTDADAKFVILKLLLQSGASLNQSDNTGVTPARDFFHKGGIKTIRMLLTEFSNITLQGTLYLHHLAERDDVRVPEVLHGISIEHDTMNAQGWSALSWAVAHNRLEMVTFLLGKGADPNKEENRGNTPLSLALGRRKFDNNFTKQIVLQLLLHGADPQQILNGHSLFGHFQPAKNSIFSNVVAYLAMLADSGNQLHTVVQSAIDTNQEIKRDYCARRHEISTLAENIIYVTKGKLSVSLHTLLYATEEELNCWGAEVQFLKAYCRFLGNITHSRNVYMQVIRHRCAPVLQPLLMQHSRLIICDMIGLSRGLATPIGENIAHNLEFDDLGNILIASLTYS